MKQKILSILSDHSPEYVTGQALANALNISRQSIWKHIHQLVKEGYPIESIHRKGYRLLSNEEQVTQIALDRLKEKLTWLDQTLFLESVDSTNTYLKHHHHQHQQTLLVADEQTSGRGRLGRVWASAPGQGLWVSLLLRPPIEPSQAAMLTQVAGVAMMKAIKECTGLQVGIKWPNDLLYQDKKLCGILTEMSAELHAVEYVIIGVGVNVNHEDFEPSLKDIATSLKIMTGQAINRMALLYAFLEHFEGLYQAFLIHNDLSHIVEALNTHSTLVGRQINVHHKETVTTCYAMAIDQEGQLLVKHPNGQVEKLYYGEVSVRKV